MRSEADRFDRVRRARRASQGATAWLAAVAVVLLAGLAARVLHPPSPPPPSPSPTRSDAKAIATSAPTASISAPEPPPLVTAIPRNIDEPADRPPPVALSTGILAWEQQLADAVRGRDGAGKARALFALLDRLPDEALTTATEHAVERLPDKDYATTALPIVINPKTRGQVLAVLFADLMERPDSIALPALLTIARNEAHPYSPPALDNLRLLLRADCGRDWPKWEAAIRDAATKP